MPESLLSVLWETFINKWFNPPLPTIALDLTGRTVIVTGANGGLGFEAAKHFYDMNPSRLILAVRTVEKGEVAKNTILKAGGNSGDTKVEVWELDLNSFESTKAFAKKANDELDRLDVLLANAGINTRQWKTTKDGWESSFQTNVLSTFLLAALLVPLLNRTAKSPIPTSSVHLRPHLVIVASDVHFFAKFPERSASHIFSTLNNKEAHNVGDRYPVTKLFDVFLTRELSHSVELEDGQVVVCSVNPGLCRSDLGREIPAFVRNILFGILARTTEEGSRTFLWASLADDIAPGSYTSSFEVTKPSAFVESPQGVEVQKKLWKELQEILIPLAPETERVFKIRG